MGIKIAGNSKVKVAGDMAGNDINNTINLIVNIVSSGESGKKSADFNLALTKVLKVLYLFPEERALLASIGTTRFSLEDYVRLSHHTLGAATPILESWIKAGLIENDNEEYRVRNDMVELIAKAQSSNVMLVKL